MSCKEVGMADRRKTRCFAPTKSERKSKLLVVTIQRYYALAEFMPTKKAISYIGIMGWSIMLHT